jgi:integrase
LLVPNASRKSRASGRTPRQPYITGQLALASADLPKLWSAIDRVDDEALLRLAVATAIRREDLVGIERAAVDIDGETCWIGYWESKKRRDRRVPISGETLRSLKKHVNTLPSRSRWLFPARRGSVGHLSGRAAWDVLNRALGRAGLERRPFHALRGTCVKVAQARGWSIEQIAELTGDSVRTIQSHYSVPSRSEMGQVARERPLE